jgi:hypothetical protein
MPLRLFSDVAATRFSRFRFPTCSIIATPLRRQMPAGASYVMLRLPPMFRRAAFLAGERDVSPPPPRRHARERFRLLARVLRSQPAERRTAPCFDMKFCCRHLIFSAFFFSDSPPHIFLRLSICQAEFSILLASSCFEVARRRAFAADAAATISRLPPLPPPLLRLAFDAAADAVDTGAILFQRLSAIAS